MWPLLLVWSILLLSPVLGITITLVTMLTKTTSQPEFYIRRQHKIWIPRLFLTLLLCRKRASFLPAILLEQLNNFTSEQKS